VCDNGILLIWSWTISRSSVSQSPSFIRLFSVEWNEILNANWSGKRW